MAKMRPARLTCKFPGCTETSWVEYENLRDERADAERRGRWRCVRHHNNGEDVLSTERPSLSTVLVNAQESYGLFWREEGEERGGSGFISGPGFKVFSKDWPAGTRLRVTVEVV